MILFFYRESKISDYIKKSEENIQRNIWIFSYRETLSFRLFIRDKSKDKKFEKTKNFRVLAFHFPNTKNQNLSSAPKSQWREMKEKLALPSIDDYKKYIFIHYLKKETFFWVRRKRVFNYCIETTKYDVFISSPSFAIVHIYTQIQKYFQQKKLHFIKKSPSISWCQFQHIRPIEIF